MNKESLFKIPLKTKRVEIPEADPPTYVIVRALGGAERDTYDASLYMQRRNGIKLNLENATAKMVVMCCVDENGERMFGDDEVFKVAKMPAGILKRIAETCKELSGITDDEIEELVETKK